MSSSTLIDTHVQVRLVDAVGADGVVAEKLSAHSAGGRRHRAFSGFLFTPDGRLLLQQRAAAKYHWPGVWSNTCCGHPASRGTVIEDARVRIGEELGLEVRELKEAAVVEYRFSDPDTGMTEWELNHVLFGVTDAVPDPDPDEVAAIRFVNASELAGVMRELGVSAWFGSVFGPLVTSAAFAATDLAPKWEWWTRRVRATDPAAFLAAVERTIEGRLDGCRSAYGASADPLLDPAVSAQRLTARDETTRPLLVLNGMLLVGADTADLGRAVPVAAAVELLHRCAVLPDEVMDGTRRQPTEPESVLDDRRLQVEGSAARRRGRSPALTAEVLADELIGAERPAVRALWAELSRELAGMGKADAAESAHNLGTGRCSIYLPLALGVLLGRADDDATVVMQACEFLGRAFLPASTTAGPSTEISMEAGLRQLRELGCDVQRVNELRQLLTKMTG
ncbi:isopentenyl-diphosphate Delta-isomerase [Nocardia asiatica]|uniref:isopentenyl-diphosphate Delta-isomerase n=1 Tax=Nocardia asiatica TaxID=209252 RepID=UPI003EE3852A